MGRDGESAWQGSSRRSGESALPKSGAAVPRIADIRASDCHTAERLLDGPEREQAQRQRPAAHAALRSLKSHGRMTAMDHCCHPIREREWQFGVDPRGCHDFHPVQKKKVGSPQFPLSSTPDVGRFRLAIDGDDLTKGT